MPTETFYCPHCKRQLTKSAQSYVLGEMISSKSSFIGFGDIPPVIICPGCRKGIDNMKMLKGEYDVHPDYKNLLPYSGLGIVAAFLLFKLVFHWGWIPALLAGMAAGFFIESLLHSAVQSLRRKIASKK